MIYPYISLNGKCKEAMKFYQEIFNGEIQHLIPNGNYIPKGLDKPHENITEWIFHGVMEICGVDFWFIDEIQPLSSGNMIKFIITVENDDLCNQYFDKLKVEGNVNLPPTETHYSTFNAIVTDKYGICWNIVSEEIPD